jgi:hypothetical protein
VALCGQGELLDDHWQADAARSAHVPLVPVVTVTMHLAGPRQGGPTDVSQAEPSATAALHVPIVPAPPSIVGSMHVPVWHRVTPPSRSPHATPPATSGSATHTSVAAHANPNSASQPGPVFFFGSHVAPAAAADAWQMPDAVDDDPTHERSGAHGDVDEHADPDCA